MTKLYLPKFKAKLSLSLLITLALAGCGGSVQDQGEVTKHADTIQGIAIDGYLARSTVYLDYDNNGTRAPWEPWAFTDNDGYFSFNPKTQKNYCASDASAEHKNYCLRNNRPITNTVLRVQGGYDVQTGEPFVGQISRRIEDEVSSTTPVVISPLTALITDAANEADKNKILSTLNIQAEDLDVDYLNTDNNNSVDSNLLNASIKTHKIVELLVRTVGENFDELNSQSGAANDLSAVIYSAIGQGLSQNTTHHMDGLFQNPQLIIEMVNHINHEAMQLSDNWELGGPITPPSSAEIEQVAKRVNEIARSVNELIPDHGDFNAENVLGAARLVQTLVNQAIDGNRSESFNNIVHAIQNPADQVAVQTLIAELNEEGADVGVLSSLNFIPSQFSESDPFDFANLWDGVVPFQNITGKQMRVSDMDLGSAPNNLKDSELEIYFEGSQNALSGSFKACVKYIEDANSNGTLGEGNTRGELVQGQWSLLSPNQLGQSTSLLLVIEFMGAKYQGILKPAGNKELDGKTYQRVRFDNAGELREWLSEVGLVTTESLPKSHQDCRARLPSRVGLSE